MRTSLRLLAVAAACSGALAIGCAVHTVPTVDHSHGAEFTDTCQKIWLQELGRPIDPPALADCLDRAQHGAHEPQLRQPVHDSDEAVAYRQKLAEPPPPPPLPNAGESGWLHVDGLRIVGDDGRDRRYRGFTDFKLFYHYLHTPAVLPALLTERIDYGANTLRVLLSAAALFDLRGDQYSDLVLDDFLDTAADRGLRIEAVVLADANPKPKFNLVGTFPLLDLQRAFLARIGAVLARHWNAIGEACNECSHEINQVDRGALARPSGQTLWERGSGQADEAPFVPAWDLVGNHAGRQDDWPRRLPCRDIRMSPDGGPWQIHAPCIENEPMGAAESPDDGRRANNPEDFAQFAAAAALNSNGALFHSDGGILSAPLGPKQAAAAHAFFDAMRWVPVNAPTWPYRRGGLSGSSAACLAFSDRYKDGVEVDRAGALRMFSKENGVECWTVVIRPGDKFVARGVDGWVVDSVGPAPGLYHAVRQ